jgi:predicted Zn-ribbon and HTH transcriptional regulator
MILPPGILNAKKFDLDMIPTVAICSHEHEGLFPASLAAHIKQIDWPTSTDGVAFMDPTLKTLKAALEAIRGMATNALSQTERPQEDYSMRWSCKECRYVKHFTKPVSLETAGRCPRCKSTEFRPIL